MSIKPLPEDVVRRIRSSAAIVSLNGVVCGLVKNSLDAGATRINLTVDYSRGNCTIEDDGLGILPLEFREAGGLGKLYRKFPPPHLLVPRIGAVLHPLTPRQTHQDTLLKMRPMAPTATSSPR